MWLALGNGRRGEGGKGTITVAGDGRGQARKPGEPTTVDWKKRSPAPGPPPEILSFFLSLRGPSFSFLTHEPPIQFRRDGRSLLCCIKMRVSEQVAVKNFSSWAGRPTRLRSEHLI